MPTALPTAGRKPAETADDVGRKLTGLHVLLILIGFFVTVAAVNALMIHFALSTFSGEVAKKPYEQGLAFNNEIKEARAQAERGWKVDGRVSRAADGKAQIEVAARDASGAALAGLNVEANLAWPTDKKRDHLIKLVDVGGGVYRGAIAAEAGGWELELRAVRDGETLFKSRNRITLE